MVVGLMRVVIMDLIMVGRRLMAGKSGQADRSCWLVGFGRLPVDIKLVVGVGDCIDRTPRERGNETIRIREKRIGCCYVLSWYSRFTMYCSPYAALLHFPASCQLLLTCIAYIDRPQNVHVL